MHRKRRRRHQNNRRQAPKPGTKTTANVHRAKTIPPATTNRPHTRVKETRAHHSRPHPRPRRRPSAGPTASDAPALPSRAGLPPRRRGRRRLNLQWCVERTVDVMHEVRRRGHLKLQCAMRGLVDVDREEPWCLRVCERDHPARPALHRGGLSMSENTCKSIKADARTRTGDPFITSEVLYQLSYVGVSRDFRIAWLPSPLSALRGCRESWSAAATVKRSRRSPVSVTSPQCLP